MALALDYQSFGVQKIGSDVQIPDNKLAKLMYYLDSVFTIFGDERYSYYTNFHNYHLLNKRQEEYVLYLARTYNASLMLDNQLFIIDPKLVDPGYNNQFYLVTDKRIRIRANSQVFVGGKLVSVQKVMACTRSWIQNFYYDPLSKYSNNNRSNNNNRRSPDLKYCYCLCYCVCSIVIIIADYYFIKYLYDNIFS